MGRDSKIEWTHHTFNPWIGCTKVSPACANCYAASYGNRFGVEWGPGKPRRRTSEANWRQPLAWNRKAEREGVRPRVFSASLADWLDDEVLSDWLADLLALVAETPNLDWLLLTKRPQLWRSRLEHALQVIETSGPRGGEDHHEPETYALVRGWLDGVAPANVWAGTTVEDQRRADERLPAFYRIPARVAFLSCEPLLEEVTLALDRSAPRIEWIICGGESGPGARPMHPAWARSLRDQVQAADVPFFFKQWGEWQAGSAHLRDPKRERIMLNDGRLIELHEDLSRYDQDGRWGSRDPNVMARVGKAEAGRELDGRTWDELPRVRS